MDASVEPRHFGALSGEGATPAARRTIAFLCLAYILATLAILPFADRPGPVLPAITTTFGAGVMIADLCTAFLLLAQVRAARSRSLLLLSAAYLYSAAMALLHVLTFTGAWIPDQPLIGTPQSVGWLFIAWVLGFPALVLAAMVTEARSGGGVIAADRVERAIALTLAAVLAAVVLLALAATTGQGWIPRQIQGNVFATWGNAAQWTSVALSAAAFLVLWRITRGRNVLFGWLGLALVAFAASNALAVAGGARYTIGWDLSRLSGFISASLLLVFFLGQFARLHRSLASALVRLSDANETLERRVAERTAELEDTNRQLRKALDERSLLLREVYHRVKNNLQVIDGMIAIQSLGWEGSPTEELLNDLRRRINALGLVHQQLMTSDDLATFDIRPFLEELRGNLSTLGGGARHGIDISVEADALRVDLDFAIPLGLIVTELVQNALKHAFPDGGSDGRRIQVGLRRCPGERLLLSVHDNGRGGSDGRNHGTMSASKGLGLSIVQALVVQLEGEMAVSGADGLRVEVRMPAPEVGQ
ncbi:MASE4 domain-containing protein [Skermanella mucosa]|uniref:sensor histidine kinase n=1 Tax=Skermanella mucosa TaxID=1789672 RepID=UPI00192C1C2E|nr:MASE4 domain-containing protein [Skermanella mucosa]UEM21096.1 MASE4 domain-containing protein [Skermanella mucosa]